jgi:hypothetical protein
MSFIHIIMVLSFAGTRAIDRVVATVPGAGVPALLAIMFWIGALQGLEERKPVSTNSEWT